MTFTFTRVNCSEDWFGDAIDNDGDCPFLCHYGVATYVDVPTTAKTLYVTASKGSPRKKTDNVLKVTFDRQGLYIDFIDGVSVDECLSVAATRKLRYVFRNFRILRNKKRPTLYFQFEYA